MKKKPNAKNSSKPQKASHGKRALIKDLMSKGFTSRKVAQTLDVVLDAWKHALWCEEVVEIPGGTIQSRIRQGKPRRKLQRFKNVQTGKVFSDVVDYPGWRRVVKFTPDKKLDLTPLPQPEPPETPEDIAARQVASELLGEPADKAMAKLQHAVKVHPQKPWELLLPDPKPGALLRRLNDIKSRGWRYDNDLDSLARQVTLQHWIK